jgi:hypothetical protein
MRKSMQLSLTGGLGNQLFQLAAAVYITEQYNFEVKLFLNDDVNTPERLGIENLIKSINFEFVEKRNTANKSIYQVEDIAIEDIIENYSVFQDRIIQGYFHNYRYAESLRPYLNSFLKNSISEISWMADLQMSDDESKLFIHYRFGDYVYNLESLGILHRKYYKKALSRVSSADSKVYVFTDSPTEAKLFFAKFIKEFHVVDDSKAKNPLEIMLALSLGDKLILSNSTFSWWSGFLSFSKEITMPKPFYRNLSRESIYHPQWSYVKSKFIH